MALGGSSLPLHQQRWHFTLCKEKRLWVRTEQLPQAEPMGPCSTELPEVLRGLGDLSHSDSRLLGSSGTGPRALGAAPLPSGRQQGREGDVDPTAGRCLAQSGSPRCSGQCIPSIDPEPPLAAGDSLCLPSPPAFPAVPGTLGVFSLFLPIFVLRAAGNPTRTSQGAGAAPAEYHRLK